MQVTADEAPGFISDIGADKVEFKFRKPNAIKIGGSYAFRGIAKPDVNVDLLVGLPKVLHDYFLGTVVFTTAMLLLYSFSCITGERMLIELDK